MKGELNYITADDILFAINESGLITANYRGEEVGRVAILRMFPFEYEEEYLCVKCENYTREDNEKEIGIIRSLADFQPQQIQLVRNELKKRYFIPEILSVYEVKDEYGHTRWKVKTTAGDTEFTVTDMNANIVNIGKGRIMLIDVYGNRYCIPDLSKLDDKTMKVLEIWI